MTFWHKLELFPPVAVRLMARHGGKALTDSEIAGRSGLPEADIRRLSYLTTWNDVLLGQAQAFLIGCAVDLEDPKVFRSMHRYLKRARFRHLRSSPQWPEFSVLLRILAKHLQS